MPAIERVFHRHGAWHYDLGRDENGVRRSKMLARFDEGEPALYKALAKIIEPAATTMRELFLTFKLHGMTELELAPRTQFDYRNYIDRQLEPWCGDKEPDEIKSPDVARYYKLRRAAGAKSSANKEVACLSSVFQYGLGEGLCSANPCRGVRRNKTKPRDRYVRHDEFLLYFDAAPDYLQDLLAGIYLMELRPGEARELRTSTITPKGVFIEQSKTGKVKVIEWSPALQFVLTRSTSRFPGAPFVFTNSHGEKWTETGMHSALATVRREIVAKAKALAAERGEPEPPAPPRWTFHDLRAKGESDHKDGGHGLLALYKRARFVTPVA
jgi:integrase